MKFLLGIPCLILVIFLGYIIYKHSKNTNLSCGTTYDKYKYPNFKSEYDIISKIEYGKTMSEIYEENHLNLVKLIGNDTRIKKEFDELKSEGRDLYVWISKNEPYWGRCDIIIGEYFRYSYKVENRTMSLSYSKSEIELIEWAIKNNFKTTTDYILKNYNN